jgi:hypothetical protein
MPWMNLSTLLVQLHQRGINPQLVTVFIDDHVVNPEYQRPSEQDLTSEETEDMDDEDIEAD